MKTTPLTSLHRELGGKMVEFAGYEMPVQYAGIIEEHKAVRNSVGVFDVSHMGEFTVRGPDALRLVQRVTTNNAAKLVEGKVQYSAMCYDDGGIVDDLLVYREKDGFMLVVNASNIRKDYDWIVAHAGDLDVEVRDISDATALLAVQGPKSLETLRPLTGSALEGIPYYAFVHAMLAGVEMIISRTGYTGELGYELYIPAVESTARKVWDAIFTAGKRFGIVPVGLGARDSLRLEMGYCLYGNDIDKTTNPIEAGLGWITKFEKGEFIGSEHLRRAKAGGTQRKLVGFVLDDERAFPRHGYAMNAAGKPGTVTSGTVSPVLGKGIGLGYIAAEAAAPGSDVHVVIRSKEYPGHVVQLPFIKK